jgi:hypothetical protein
LTLRNSYIKDRMGHQCIAAKICVSSMYVWVNQ